MTSRVEYKGELRCSSLHIGSNNEIITDAPTDNHGKGEAFSPTDLVATALAGCMLTVMGIKARQSDIDIVGTEAEVTKIMSSDPRRISEVRVLVKMPDKNYDQRTRILLEKTARTCPVAYSLSEKLTQTIRFQWFD